MTCLECKWYHERACSTGVCFRHAPVAGRQKDECDSVSTFFPSVCDIDYCGDFEKMEDRDYDKWVNLGKE